MWGTYLVTFDRTAGEVITIDHGALVEKDGIIIEVGEKGELKRNHPHAEELGSSRCMVLPGLVNAHCHGKGLTNFQLGTLDEGLELWILELRKQREVDPYLDTLYSAIKQVETGVTTLVHNHYRRDHLGYEEELEQSLKAYLQSGLRVALSIGIKDSNTYVYQDNKEFLNSLPADLAEELRKNLDGSGEISRGEYFSIVQNFHEKYDGMEGRLRVMLGPVGPQWCSDELLTEIGETADRRRMGLHFHLLESVYQDGYHRARHGRSALAHLEELGLLGPRTSCAHGVWVDEGDVELLARTGTSLIQNPGSNLRLKSGIMPLSALLAAGVNVGLGTDGMTLNDDDDFIQEMRLCHKLHRLPGLESFSPAPADVFRMATVDGARAALMEETTGTLKVGAAADAILMRTDRLLEPFLEEGVSPLEGLLYRGRGSDVETVMVGGKVLMKDRVIIFADKAEVVEELKKSLLKETRRRRCDEGLLIERLRPYILEFYRGWDAHKPDGTYIYNKI
jgi:cytosine/adenosine deaminase-related metal-dependent hydrolase